MRSFRLPRDLRLARLPLLLAYLLVLLGTPVGEAGFLWMHLSTAHSTPVAELAGRVGLRSGEDAAVASAPGHERDTLPAHEHEHEHAGAHGHPHSHEHEPASEHAHTPSHGYGRAALHEHATAHEHASGHAAGEHAHPHEGPHATQPQHLHIASEAEARSFAPDEPHEHGGRVHTHDQHPVPDAALVIDALSKFYLSPPTTSAPSASADARHASRILPAPHQVAARIDTPPPRLPG